jgi:anti-sigma factor RsiW
MSDCETIKKKLGAWLDRELKALEAERVQKHLEGCPSCSAEKERLERLELSISQTLEGRAAAVSFDAIWRGVEERMQKRTPWPLRLWERLELFPLRARWVLPLAAVLLVALFSRVGYLPEWRARNNFTFVESIDAYGSNVALFREAETRTTVIWLFEDLENQDEGSEESAAPVSGF